MNKLLAAALLALICIAAGGCGKQQQAAPGQPAASQPAEGQPAKTETSAADAAKPATEESAATAPAETVSETDDAPQAAEQAPSGVQPALRLGATSAGPATSERFKEGTSYRKVVPAQPTSAAPGKVEVLEVFWYACPHCFELDPQIEAWRKKGKPAYVEFTRVPAMWNDTLRIQARLYYATEALGKLDELHTAIFREIHVNGNPLNTLERMQAFFKQHGVSPEEFQKAFSSFGVESKLQRADFLNRRFQINSVPVVIVNGKYVTDRQMAGGDRELFDLIDELAAHEHGG
ncbi:MAG TPA: DsbA family protein [Steroidobacteraceae bacterium]|jgi:thiol:disulfide interchange protein DsbA